MTGSEQLNDARGSTNAGTRIGTGGSTMPTGVRRVLWTGVGLLLAGALYLIAVRGEAILAGLTTLAQICF
jgi:hypothetical protein